MKLDLDSIKVFDNDLSEEVFKIYSKSKLLAVDCEMMGLIPHRDRLCLIQMCNEDGVIALVKLGVDLKEKPGKDYSPTLKKLFEDESIKKIFHFGRTDLSFLFHWLDINLKNIFCTKCASKLIRTFTDKHSLKDLVKEFIGANMDKSSQSTDWGADSLTRDQLKYAASDVIYLIEIYNKQIPILERENRLEIAENANKFLPTLAKLDLLGFEDFFAH